VRQSSEAPWVPVAGAGQRSFGILSTFPPTACGIATFSAALAAGLVASGATVDVVRCGSAPPLEDPLVLASLEPGSTRSQALAVEVLDRSDVVVVQHEYGIYGGADGEEVVAVLEALTVPTVLVAHTVLAAPSAQQRAVLARACAAAQAVVVMTESGRAGLIDGFGVDAAKVHVIAHGAATPLASAQAPERRWPDRAPRLLTWGLLGPGKGIEWALDALSALDDIRPRPQYLVAGSTHPKVRARSGEAYRRMLVARVHALGLGDVVTFDDTYRDLAGLTELIVSADVVVLPYDSREQVTSGVLVDAVAAGRPVVSTAFPHAIELLASGAGLVVPQRDPIALAGALRAVLTDHDLAASMAAEARRLAPGLSWHAVALQYADLARHLLDASVRR
jgi:polysaccharide biosynthesis protein PslF